MSMSCTVEEMCQMLTKECAEVRVTYKEYVQCTE